MSRAARSGIVSPDSAANVVIVFRRQINRFRLAVEIQHPHVRLRVRPHRLLNARNKGQRLPTRRKRYRADATQKAPNAKRSQQFRCSAASRDRHDFCLWQVIIRLRATVRGEENVLPIQGEHLVMLVECAARQLAWRSLCVCARRQINNPNVLRVFRIRVPSAVETVDGTGDDLYIALMFRLGRRVFLLLLGEILRSGVA